MAKKPKNQPYDPAKAERIRQEREANRREIDRLKAQDGVTVNTDERTGRLVGARRLDCFALLLRGREEDHGAVTWLDTLLRTASGENTPERQPDYIRASCEGAPGQNVTDAMIDAGEMLVVVAEALAPRDARMLFGLLQPDASLMTRWRPLVERCTGETNAHAQGAAVRSACASLLWVQANMARLMRERRVRREAA